MYIKRLFWKKQAGKKLHIYYFFPKKRNLSFVDNKKHGVFLIYHYSENSDKFAKQQLEQAIFKIKQAIEKMGLSVLDDNKIYNSESKTLV